MHGSRSRVQNLLPFDPEIERTLRNIRAKIKTLGSSPPLKMAEEQPKLLREYFTPTIYTSPSCIRLPEVAAVQYEIKSSVIQMLPSFYGLTNEDPYKHLDEFLEICTTVKIQNFTDDALKLRLFPFSLKDRAKQWLNSLEANSIRSWDQMQQEFLKKILFHRKNEPV